MNVLGVDVGGHGVRDGGSASEVAENLELRRRTGVDLGVLPDPVILLDIFQCAHSLNTPVILSSSDNLSL